jgi:propanol-preferring alcohol dehydrogenase
VTLGHEVAGVVEAVGAGVGRFQLGDRVCIHYLLTCGECVYCAQGQEQFCVEGQMIGKHCDGGYAEAIAVPTRSLVALPDGISYEHGAVMMCSSATSLHALRKGRLAVGETAAIFGIGGLGMSAVQLALALGARRVFAIDINAQKLAQAEAFGAIAVDASEENPVDVIRRRTGRRGVDVALELVGLPETMRQAVLSLGIQGRAVLAGITQDAFNVYAYRELIGREAEIIGCSDHLLQEFPLLLDLARQGKLNLNQVVLRTVPLEAGPINGVLDALDEFGREARTVIVP